MCRDCTEAGKNCATVDAVNSVHECWKAANIDSFSAGCGISADAAVGGCVCSNANFYYEDLINAANECIPFCYIDWGRAATAFASISIGGTVQTQSNNGNQCWPTAAPAGSYYIPAEITAIPNCVLDTVNGGTTGKCVCSNGGGNGFGGCSSPCLSAL